MVDGEDIGRLGLEHVRKAFAVIPQTSFIFKGTLRFNIDPMDEVHDSVIASTLTDFDLADLLVPDDYDQGHGQQSPAARVGPVPIGFQRS